LKGDAKKLRNIGKDVIAGLLNFLFKFLSQGFAGLN
jgi:hypothetical protein